MDVRQLTIQLEQVMKFNEELREQNTSLAQMVEQVRDENTAIRQEIATQRQDYESLLNSTQTLIDDRDKLQRRVDELEAIKYAVVTAAKSRRPCDISGADQKAMRKPAIRGCRIHL